MPISVKFVRHKILPLIGARQFGSISAKGTLQFSNGSTFASTSSTG